MSFPGDPPPELVPPSSPPAPALPGEVVVRPTIEDLLDEIAADVFTQASNCVRAFGDFHLAMSGGRAAQRLAMRLMTDPQYRELPWKRTHLWITSEVAVPEEDDRSTIGTVRDLLGDHAGIPPRQVHAMRPHLPDGAARYEKELLETLAWREKGHDRLDCVVLGVDEGGAIDGVHDEGLTGRGLVQPGRVEGDAALSLTSNLVRASRLICVMGIGEHGAAVRRLAKTATPESLRPLAGVLRWYLDHAACKSGGGAGGAGGAGAGGGGSANGARGG